MDENRLRELLVQTDAVNLSSGGGDLIGEAIRRRFRRRRNAAIGGAIGACAVIAIAGFQLMQLGVSSHHEVAWEKPVAKIVQRDEVADAIQLDVATRTVDKLLRDERERVVSEHVRRLAEERFILRQEREADARRAAGAQPAGVEGWGAGGGVASDCGVLCRDGRGDCCAGAAFGCSVRG